MGSTSEAALRIAVDAAAGRGAQVRCITGPDLVLPMYEGPGGARDARTAALVDAVRWADGLIIASPGYHGAVSGLVKNALDYIEDLRLEPDGTAASRPYLDGVAVGCIAVAAGWQAAVSTLHQLRTIVHSLRGWPTPYGAAVNTQALDSEGDGNDHLEIIGRQVVEFAWMRRAGEADDD